MLFAQNEKLRDDNVYLAHMYAKKPMSQQEYEIKIDRMENQLTGLEMDRDTLAERWEMAKGEGFEFLNAVVDADSRIKTIEDSLHPMASKQLIEDIKEARASLARYVEIRQACESQRMPR